MDDNTVVDTRSSILQTIKLLLGITPEFTEFDDQIITHINSVFLTLSQLGVGPEAGFYIESSKDEWTSFIPDGLLLNAVKSYMYLKVRLLFDPPAASNAVESMNRIISEYESRINYLAEETAGVS